MDADSFKLFIRMDGESWDLVSDAACLYAHWYNPIIIIDYASS